MSIFSSLELTTLSSALKMSPDSPEEFLLSFCSIRNARRGVCFVPCRHFKPFALTCGLFHPEWWLIAMVVRFLTVLLHPHTLPSSYLPLGRVFYVRIYSTLEDPDARDLNHCTFCAIRRILPRFFGSFCRH